MGLTNQSEFIHSFNDKYREHFNPELFKRDNQEIMNSIEQVVRSMERDKYFTLKLLSFEPIYDYEKIHNTLREHEENRRKKNSKTENTFDYININDTDMMLCKIIWLVRHNGLERQEIDGKTIEVMNPEQTLEVLIALPRFVKGYYFRLNGNYYTTTFQVIDGSTYNNINASQAKSDTVTMKTMFMPIRVFRSLREMHELNTDTTINVIEYNTIIFNNVVSAMYYILAHFGIYGASDFLGIDCVWIDRVQNTNPDFVCFEKNGIYVSAPKVCFQDAMVQSFVATIIDGINKDATIEALFDIRYWLKNLGIAFKNGTIDKGLFVLDSIDGIYDNITKRDLHLPDEDKENIYTIIRWLLREFSELRIKENVDIRTKRIRIADYISAIYAKKINQGMYRISDLGKKVTLKKVVQAIYTNPLYVLNNVSGLSNLVSYRDLVNDDDALTALKFTYKGISGLGEDGASVQPIYRYVDPSHVGILDLDSSSNSDPGMSGMICPMTKLYDKSFSEYEEPNTWRESYKKLNEEYKQGTINPIAYMNDKPDPDYKDIRTRIEEEQLELSKIVCPIVSLIDPNIQYTALAAELAMGTPEVVKSAKKSLFTIINEETDSGFFASDDEDDSDNEGQE